MATSKLRVVMLCGDWQTSKIMFNALAPCVDITRVIVEEKPSGFLLARRRLKKIGLVKLVGQVLFTIVNKVLAKTASERVRRIMVNSSVSDKAIDPGVISKVRSVNDDETISLLQKSHPQAVVVNGTRIISARVLAAVDAPFLNTHLGITPKYRGAHGGYWALARHDPENCGVTVHLVDEGIDTGGVLFQDTIQAEPDDNINTYPLLQIVKAIPLMKEALNDIKQNRLAVKPSKGPSQLFHQPTLWEYFMTWIRSGVK